MKTEFFMAMIPPTVTKQEHQVAIIKNKKGKSIPRFYDPPELKAAESKLEAHLGKHIPQKKFTGPLQVIVKWCFPITGNHYDGEWKITKPDLENLEKQPFDIMQRLNFYNNDAIICSKITQKFWAEKPGIYICIEELIS
jgi:Holliday junction resolvase RusA-like endonuclease